MKKIVSGMLLGLVLGGAAMWLWSGHTSTTLMPVEQSNPSGSKEETVSPNEVKLSREMQTAAGLVMAVPVAVEAHMEIHGYGRVLDASSLMSGLLEIETAQNVSEASSKEYARIQTLYAQNQNASLQALEMAGTARKRDELLLTAARARLTALWGDELLSLPGLPELAKLLNSFKAALIRIDLLPGEILEEQPKTAKVIPLTGGLPQQAVYVGPAPNVDPQSQGRGLLFLLQTNAPVPGTAVNGFLNDSNKLLKGWRIPPGAIVRHMGQTWVFCQKEDAIFVRQPIRLDLVEPEGWFSTGPLTGKERLVVTGAQILLSEELKGATGE